MKQFSMTCTCGHEFTVEAENREEAVAKIKAEMTEDVLKAHMAEKHPGEPVPTLTQSHALVDQMTKEVVAAA